MRGRAQDTVDIENGRGQRGRRVRSRFRWFGSDHGACNTLAIDSPEHAPALRSINQFITISTFTRHIVAMVFDRRSGFWLGYFAIAAFTSGPCF
jgi:hypothetical protein